MSDPDDSGSTDDPYDLRRFVRAQDNDYAQALSEIRSGQKRTHWMRYIFPQIDGLAFSSTSRTLLDQESRGGQGVSGSPHTRPEAVGVRGGSSPCQGPIRKGDLRFP